VAIKPETGELPVRSAVLKHRTGGLVVRWVTTSESPLLYIFAVFANRWERGWAKWVDLFWWPMCGRPRTRQPSQVKVISFCLGY
jgi:hypothetical protein